MRQQKPSTKRYIAEAALRRCAAVFGGGHMRNIRTHCFSFCGGILIPPLRKTICLLRNLLLLTMLACEAPPMDGVCAADADLDAVAGGALPAAIELYFSDPPAPAAAEKRLCELIALQASGELYLCCYEIDSEPVLAALAAAVARGVTLVFCGDPDNAHDESYKRMQELTEPDKFALPDEYSGTAIMHNKFVLVTADDGRKFVWCGSSNITDTDLVYNNNNVVIIRSEAVFDIYLRQLRFLMKMKDRQGLAFPPLDRVECVSIEGVVLEIFFSYAFDGRAPSGQPMAVARDLVSRASGDIRFMIFTFGTQNYAEHDLVAALTCKASSLALRGIFDKSQAATSHGAEVFLGMREAGLAVLCDGNENMKPDSVFGGGKLHHKVLIVDPDDPAKAAVLTGSMNFTRSANSINAENSIIIHSYAAAQLYKAEFERRWREAAL